MTFVNSVSLRSTNVVFTPTALSDGQWDGDSDKYIEKSGVTFILVYPYWGDLHCKELSQRYMWFIWRKQGQCEQSCDSSLDWDWHGAAVTCQSGGESHDAGIQILILGTNKLISLTCFQN